MLDLGDDLSHQPKTTADTMHSDSDLQDDIFAPVTTIERSSKFHHKPRINNKKTLPKPSKSDAAEGPSSTSKFLAAADSKWPVEGSNGPSSGFLCSPVFSSSQHVVQDPEVNIEYSVSTNLLDKVPQLCVGESKQCIDMPCCLESLDGYVNSFSASETKYYDSDLHDDTFGPTATTERTSKFCPKPRSNTKKTHPTSKSGHSEVPLFTSIFPDAEDNMFSVEGSIGTSSEFLSSSVASHAPYVVQDRERNAECSISNDVHDEALQSDRREPILGTDMTRHLESLVGDVQTFSTSETVGGCQVNAKESVETVNPVHGGDDSVDILRQGFSSFVVRRSSESDANVKPSSIPVEVARYRANASQAWADMQISKETATLSNLEGLDDSFFEVNARSGAAGHPFTSNLYFNNSEPISISSVSEVTQSPLETKGFAANIDSSHLSGRDANLQTDSAKATTVHSSVEPLDDLFLKSDPPAVKQIGKFQPKPALRMKERKKTKSVSFILPNNDGELAASFECQPEPVTSNPIRKISSFVEMMSDQMDDSLGSLSTCNRDNQVDLFGLVREDVMDISTLDTLDIPSEPICNSDEHVETFQSEIQARTRSARANAGNSPGLIKFGYSKLDSLHIGSVATTSASISLVDTASENSQLDSLPIHNESLDAHVPGFPSGDLFESLPINADNCFLTNSSEEKACLGTINDLEAQSLIENEDLHTMEGVHTIDHIEEPNIEESAASIVQNDADGKSSRRARQRNKKLKSTLVDKVSEAQNAKNTISEMDDGYGGNGYKVEDMPKIKKRKAPRKSSSSNSEHQNSIMSSGKASEKPDSTVKDPPKKRLPHGSRCKSTKRQVNKALLDIPDDELDRRQLVIRDLIRLAGFKERISNKDAAVLKNSFANQSEEHEQDPNCDDANGDVQREGPRLNYHSYMRRPHQTRWSKTDTELFYQAIRQFGTDFAMIQVLFPTRSRQQVKAKFKNEQSKHPFQIDDALVHRSKDHSPFEKVIQHLQAVAEQNSKNDASDQTTKSQDEADENEEERMETNSKEDQDANCFEGGVECSLKANDFDQHSEASSDGEKFWM